MNSSKEDLLEMSDLNSPLKKLPHLRLKKKRNQVHSPPGASPAPARFSDDDLTPIFSVKKPYRTELGDTDDAIHSSDDLSSELSTHNCVKRRSGNNNKIAKLKHSLEHLRLESSRVDDQIQSVRSKLPVQPSLSEFSFFNFLESVSKADVNEDSDVLMVPFLPPEHMGFNIRLAEKDRFCSKNIDLPFTLSPVRLRCFKPQEIYVSTQAISYLPAAKPLGQLDVVVVVKSHLLEVEVCSVKFLHHPLFSLEHVLVEMVRQALERYQQWNEETTVAELINELGQLRNSGKLKAMRRLRQRVFRAGKLHRQTLKHLLELWVEVKKLRASQQYSVNNAQLAIIKKLKRNRAGHSKLFEELLTDIIEEKTKKKKTIQRDQIEAKLRCEFEESFQPAEEPELEIKLVERLPNVDESTEIDCDEASRRKVTSSTKFTIKISCEEVPVCKSRAISLDQNFTLDFNEVFSIQLTDVPKWLTLELFEHPKGLLKKKLAQLKLEVPPFDSIFESSKTVEGFFERRELVHYKHAGVGSGRKLDQLLPSLACERPEVLYTKGMVCYRIGWQRDHSHDVVPKENWKTRLVECVDKWGFVDAEQLRSEQMIGQLGEHLENFEEAVRAVQEGSHFRLSPHLNALTFCPPEAIDTNLRLRYLRLRAQNELEFDGIMIPNRIREMPLGLIKDFQRRKALEGGDEVNDNQEEDAEGVHESGRRRLGQVHARVFQAAKRLGSNLSYESVVDEKYLIYLEEIVRTSLRNFFNWFRWRPKLSKPLPQRFSTPQPSKTALGNKILIKVLGTKNLPRRINSEDDHQEEVFQVLEVHYEEFSASIELSRDVRNEVLELPLRYHQVDYLNPSALAGAISFNLFDRVRDLDAGGERRERGVWLGEVRVPLSALTTGLSLSGWFQLYKPALVFGYQTVEELAQLTKSPKHSQAPLSDQKTFIHLELKVSPTVPLMEPNMANLPSNDAPYVRDHVLKWNQAFNATFPCRSFRAMALDCQGRTTCITRYLRPLEPPQVNNEDFEVTPEQCLKYVSLVPFTESGSFYQNVWLTSEQFLDFKVGSVMDHCVALTCFLLALKMDAYLVIGYGIPQGFTSYVLLIEPSRTSNNSLPTYTLMDVVYKRKFDLADPFCPLQRIHCIANGENVWGNAQRAQNPALLRFDLARRSDWWPLFNADVSAPSNFVNNKINLVEVRKETVEEVEREILRKLKRKMAKWRPMERTTFNLKFNDKLRNSLKQLEITSMHCRSNVEPLLDLIKTMSAYKVEGVVLNLPFLGIHEIIKQIKRMELHVQPKGVTEFGLSVFVQAYPGQVLSVWLFLGTFDEILP